MAAPAKRRSWFDQSQQAVQFEVAVEKPPSRGPRSPPEGEIEVLTLTHFTKPPRIGFETVKVGHERTRHLRVINPHDYEQEVIIEKFPTSKNFSIDLLEFTVEPEDELLLTMEWAPKEAGNVREMIQFQVNDAFRLTAIMFGKAEEIQKPKKRKGLGRGKRLPVTEHKENVAPRKVLQSRENVPSKTTTSRIVEKGLGKPLRVPSQPTSRPQTKTNKIKVAPVVSVVDASNTNDCVSKEEIERLVESLPEPEINEEIHYRDSLEDPDLETVQDEYQPPLNLAATFIAGRASTAARNIHRPEIERSYCSSEMMQNHEQKEVIRPMNATYIPEQHSSQQTDEQETFVADSTVVTQGGSNDNTVISEATYINQSEPRFSEFGTKSLEHPAMNSTAVPDNVSVLQNSNRRESSIRNMGRHSFTNQMKNKFKQRIDWRNLGNVNSLTPIDKRQSQMHHFHDLGESIMEEIIVQETVEEEMVERVEEEIIETVTTETWLDDGKGGRKLVSSTATSEPINRQVTENKQARIETNFFSKDYEDLVENDPAMEVLPDTPTRRMTYKKEGPFLPKLQVELVKNDPALNELPDTPSKRMTFVKDDPDFVETPSKRMTFIKDDPSMPITPVRRDTFLTKRPAMSNTPVVEVVSPSNDFARLNHSASPTKTTPVIQCQFADDTEVRKNQKRSTNSLRRSGTFTKLNGDLSQKPHRLFPENANLDAPGQGLTLDDLSPYHSESEEAFHDDNDPIDHFPLQQQSPKLDRTADSRKSSDRELRLSDFDSPTDQNQSIYEDALDVDSPGAIDSNSYTKEDSILCVDQLPVIEDGIPKHESQEEEGEDQLEQMIAKYLQDTPQPGGAGDIDLGYEEENFNGNDLPMNFEESLTEARNLLARESLVNPAVDESLVEVRRLLALENKNLDESISEAQRLLTDMNRSGQNESLHEVSVLLSNASESFIGSPMRKSPGLKKRFRSGSDKSESSVMEDDVITSMVNKELQEQAKSSVSSFKFTPDSLEGSPESLPEKEATSDPPVCNILSKSSHNKSHFHVTFSDDTKGGLDSPAPVHSLKNDSIPNSHEKENLPCPIAEKNTSPIISNNLSEIPSSLHESFSHKEAEELVTVKEELQSRLSSTPVALPKAAKFDDEDFGQHQIKTTPSPIIGRRVSQLTVTKNKPIMLLPDVQESNEDPEFKTAERFSRIDIFENNAEPANPRRFSTLTVTKSKPEVLKVVEAEGKVRRNSSRQLFSDRDRSRSPASRSRSVSPIKSPRGRIIPTRFASHTSPMGRGTPTRPHLSPSGRHLSPTSPPRATRAEATPEQLHGIFMKPPEETPSAFVVHTSRMTSKLIKREAPAREIIKAKPEPSKVLKKPPVRKSFENSRPATTANKKVVDVKSKRPSLPTGRIQNKQENENQSRRPVHQRKNSGTKRTHSTERSAAKKVCPNPSKSEVNSSSNAQNKKSKMAQSLPIGAGADQRLTRTMALRRQAALNSMNKSVSNVNNRSRQSSGKSSSGGVKGVAKSKLVLIKKATHSTMPKHPMPFAAKNIYYDERWMEKQERGFVRWLNFILTPPEEEPSNPHTQTIDAGKILMDAQRGEFKVAPTKETLSYRSYSAKRRLNRLRRNACLLFQTETLVKVHEKLEREITCERLLIRKDRQIHADLGLKQMVLRMLLSYNPLWLRIGIETVFGEILPLQDNLDIMGLSQYIARRLLNNPDICAKYAHPTVPHLYKDGFSVAINQFMLKKFLLLVLFLDKAKQSRLIDHDPCLFCKDAEYKTSKDLLINFSRQLLSGEGDITKHLGYLGYSVSHMQTARDEYDYAVTNLASDIKDGVRITRVIEMLTQSYELSKNLRVPAISRLQKIHNVGVALTALGGHGVDLACTRGGKIDTRDVVDGHREKTLQLLWKIIFNFQVETLLPVAQLEEEVSFVRQNLALTTQLAALLSDRYLDGEQSDHRESVGGPDTSQITTSSLTLLLQWCRAVCAYYDMKIENFTVSFSDGRAFCYIVHHYHPNILKREKIKLETTLTYEGEQNLANASFNSEDSFSENWTQTINANVGGKNEVFDSLLANERENFKILYEAVSEIGGVPLMLRASDMSNTIPDEKVTITYLMYLCARILDIRQETRAARIIQAWWRRIYVNKHIVRNKGRHQAASVIQSAVRSFLKRQRERRLQGATVVLQAHWRGWMARRQAAKLREERLKVQREKATVLLQAVIRSWLFRKQLSHQQKMATKIQAYWRAYTVRKQYNIKLNAIRLLQAKYRATKQAEVQRARFLKVRDSVVRVQTTVKGFLARRLLQKHKMARCVQTAWRGYKQRKAYLLSRKAAVTIQSYFKMVQARRCYVSKLKAVCVIQQRYRAYLQGKQVQHQYQQLQQASRTIQRFWRGRQGRHLARRVRAARSVQAAVRGWLCRRQLRRQRAAALVIQHRWRAMQLMKAERMRFHIIRGATLVIQEWALMIRTRREFQRKRRAAGVIQSTWRTFCLRERFLLMQKAATVLQGWWKAVFEGRKVRQEMKINHAAALIIQTHYRRHKARKQYLHQRHAVIKAQSLVRSHQARKNFIRLKAAAIIIQHKWRAVLTGRRQRAEYTEQKVSVIKIQSVFRGFRLRREIRRDHQRAVTVQKFVRMQQARRRFLLLKSAALVLQSRVRATLLTRREQKNFQIFKQSAVKIQSSFRGWKARTQYKDDVRNITKIQSIVRMKLCRKMYLKKKDSASIIQQKWRATLLGRRQHGKFLVERSSAVKIQSFYRGFVARRQYIADVAKVTVVQSLVRSHQARMRYIRLKAAALIVQNRWRAVLLGRVEKQKYNTMRNAAVMIQKSFRMYRSRKDYNEQVQKITKVQSYVRMHQTRRKFFRMKAAAVIIQHRLRATLLSKRQHEEYQKMTKACVRIQAWYRMCRGKKNYDMKRKRVILLQSLVRRNQSRRRVLKLKAASLILQDRWRATLLMRQEQRSYQKMKNSAIVFQSAYRRRIAQRNYQQMRQAAIRLQSVIRCHQARQAYLEKKEACVKIQKKLRATLLARREHGAFLCMRSSAITIQAFCRGMKVRKEFSTMRKAAVKIQSFVRCHQKRQKYLKTKKAATLIQKKWKATLLARRQQKHYHSILGATIIIQSQYRAHKARQSYQKDVRSITIVQAQVRRFIERQRYLKVIWATAVIKKHWFNTQVATQQRRRYLAMKQAAIKIQSAWRCHTQKMEYQSLRSAAILIQSYIRCFIARKRYVKQKFAVTVIQQKWRATLAMKNEKEGYQKMQLAAQTIQAKFREYKVRKTYNETRSKIILLQSVIRMRLTRNRFLDMKKSVQVLQCRWRATLACRQQLQKFQSQKKSALLIQKVFKGYLARKSYLQNKKKITKCQSVVRMYMARKQYQKVRFAVQVISRRRKALIVGRQVREEYQNRKSAAITLQSHWRKYKAQTQFKRKVKQVEKVQSYVRMFLNRRVYVKKLASVRVLQSYWRATLEAKRVQEHYAKQKAACVKIQSAFRTYRARKEYKSDYWKVVKVQSLVRMYIAKMVVKKLQAKSKEMYLRNSQAAFKIQMWWRACQLKKTVQNEYLEKKAASLVIQKCWRCYQQKRQYGQMKQKVIRMQSLVRCILQRRQYLKLRDSIIVCQRRWRAKCSMQKTREHYTIQKTACIRIQKVWRMYKAKREFRTRIARIVKVQCAVRCFLARRTLTRLIEERQQKMNEELLRKRSEHLSRFTCVTRKHLAVIQIQRAFRRRKSLQEAGEKIQKVVFLQAMWRGYRVRQAVKDYKIHEARRRCVEAKANATEDKRLCNRTASALEKLLSYKQLALVLEAVSNLDAVTRLSPKCCESMVANNAVPVIFKLMKGCNRSLPHMEIVKHSVNILLNLTKYEKTVGAVYACEGSLDILLDLMTVHREKGVSIFSKCCVLIAIFCYDPQRAQQINKQRRMVEKFTSFQRLAQRKRTADDKREMAKSRMAAAKSFNSTLPIHPTPAKTNKPMMRPEWVLHRHKMREITDPLQAINYLMAKLGK